MGLKRKRSTPTLSSPNSSSSSSPLPSFYTQSKPIETLYNKPTWSFPTYDEGSSHLNSRTRKRHRDGRPEEGVVFENTMNRLYNAQREQRDTMPMICASSPPNATAQPPQRSTLHSFWRIAQPPTSIPMVLDCIVQQDSRCEDCDGCLRHEEAMEIDEDVWMQETSCGECGRRVCDACAVRGKRRVCLGCAQGR